MLKKKIEERANFEAVLTEFPQETVEECERNSVINQNLKQETNRVVVSLPAAPQKKTPIKRVNNKMKTEKIRASDKKLLLIKKSKPSFNTFKSLNNKEDSFELFD